MTRMLPPLLLAAALTGCNAGEGEVWLFSFPLVSDVDCDTTITENFEDADPPEEIEIESDWILEVERDYSNRLAFGQIVKGKKKVAYLVIDDTVYPGTREGKTFTFSWTKQETSSERAEYIPSEYKYVEEIDNQMVTTIKLERDKETRGLAGTFEVEQSRNEAYQETDEWDSDVPGVYFLGAISGPAMQWLVGEGNTNEREREDCETDTCRLTVLQECKGSLDITAEWVGYGDEGVFAAIEDAEQSAGI